MDSAGKSQLNEAKINAYLHPLRYAKYPPKKGNYFKFI